MRLPDNPWPEWPRTFTVSSSQEEGSKMEFAIETKEFMGRDGKIAGIKVVRTQEERDGTGRRKLIEVPGSEFIIPADLVLLAMGYTGPETSGIITQLELALTGRNTVATDDKKMTGQKGFFAAGDAARGQSLIVWAIAEGRKVAESVDEYLINKI
jgi:glutamate synthase (NADPH/NADH) small chain